MKSKEGAQIVKEVGNGETFDVLLFWHCNKLLLLIRISTCYCQRCYIVIQFKTRGNTAD